MPREPFKTYLRMYRKRTGHSLTEIAFLLGSMSPTTVSRHERGVRVPSLRLILGYEHLVGAAPKDLYEAMCREVQEIARTRARGLLAKLGREKQTKLVQKKCENLRRLIAFGTDAGADHLS